LKKTIQSNFRIFIVQNIKCAINVLEYYKVIMIFIFLRMINKTCEMKKYVFILATLAVLAGCGNNGSNKKSDLIEGPGISVKNGMVVSAHPESSRIGVYILEKGGNAIDAAVATGFALAVCYPEAGNIGGGGFMVIRTSDGTIDAIDYREKAPLNGSRDMYLDESGNVIKNSSTDTHLASGVPGSVDGLLAAHAKYGKLPLKEVIQPAIDLAENGYPIPKNQVRSFNGNRKTFLARNLHKPAFVNDSLWKEGDIIKQPELAATLRLVRDKGRKGFYSGKVAEMIVAEMKRGNGLISLQDLEEYKSVWRPPLTGIYRGYKIITVAPPSSGGVTLLQLLGMCENYPLKEIGYSKMETVHLIIEAERRSFADRAEFLGDPDFVTIPLKQLLDHNYLVDRMKSFNPDKASLSSEIGHGTPDGYISEETTHYSVVDGQGNAVSTTTTLNGGFGNSIVVDGAGFLLNNEMDDFSVKPGFPNMYGLVGGEANSIKPGKRMLSSMTPTIVEKDGKLFMVVGSPGGSTIATAVFQVIINAIDFGMTMQDAVNAGRFHHQWMPDNVTFERNSIDSTALVKLKQMGHKMLRTSAIGRVNAIMILPDGTISAGADPRGNNVASGF
jgi:gamma-glutamyltranspeptidase / glutathione hydrolase